MQNWPSLPPALSFFVLSCAKLAFLPPAISLFVLRCAKRASLHPEALQQCAFRQGSPEERRNAAVRCFAKLPLRSIQSLRDSRSRGRGRPRFCKSLQHIAAIPKNTQSRRLLRCAHSGTSGSNALSPTAQRTVRRAGGSDPIAHADPVGCAYSFEKSGFGMVLNISVL